MNDVVTVGARQCIGMRRNHSGEKVATGVYFYTLKAGEFSATRRMLIMK